MTNLPKWGLALADELKSLFQSQQTEKIIPYIQAVFKQKSLRSSTMINYLSQLQRILIERNVMLHLPTQQSFKIENEEQLQRVKTLLSQSPFRIFLLWKRLQRSNNKDPIWGKLKNWPLILPPFDLIKFNGNIIKDGLTVELQRHQYYVHTHPSKICISDGLAFTHQVLKGILSNDLGTIFPALCLASGRRPSTFFLYPNSFEEHENPYLTYFTERLKVRDQLRSKKEIPLLVKYDLFKKGLDTFQSLLPFKPVSPVEVNKKYEKQILIWVYNSTLLKIKPYYLRAIYARIAFDIFGSVQQHPLAYMKEILLHQSLDSTLSYDKVIIDWKNNLKFPFDLENPLENYKPTELDGVQQPTELDGVQ